VTSRRKWIRNEILTICKVVLGPVLLAQGQRVRRTALRLTEAAGERSGLVVIESALPELKLFFVGDSTMAGVGVRHQSAALASQVASILSNRLVRSVRWQLFAKSGVNTRQALEFVKDRELLPADVLVTALGTNDVTSQKKPYQFVADYEALVDLLLKRSERVLQSSAGCLPCTLHRLHRNRFVGTWGDTHICLTKVSRDGLLHNTT
jgi:hypothetical protein